MELKDISYEDFPPANKEAAGMKELYVAEKRERFRCRTHINVEYAVKNGIPLHLHIIEPHLEQWEEERRFPIVIYIQGSAWMEQNLGSELPQLSVFAARGYVVAIVEYRHSGIAAFPAQVLDAKTAVRYMMEHGKEYLGNPEEIYVWGDSSGGHTANMVNVTMNDASYNEPGEIPPLSIKAFVDFYGPTDITRMNDEPTTQDHLAADSPEGRLIGFKAVNEHPELTWPTNPINHLAGNKDVKPTLIIHGDKDRLVPFGQSILYYEGLKEAGIPVDFYKLKGADHCGRAFWSNEVLDIVENFFNKYRS